MLLQEKLVAEENAIPSTGKSANSSNKLRQSLFGSNVPYNNVGICLAFERRFEQMKQDMLTAAKLKIQLLNNLKNSPAEGLFQAVEGVSRRLAEYEINIRKTHDGLSKLQANSGKLTIIYAYFVLLVWNNRSEAKRMASKAQLLIQTSASESRSGSSQRSKAIQRATTMKKQNLINKKKNASVTSVTGIDKIGDVPVKGFVSVSLEDENFGELQEVDQYCQNMLGYKRDELLGKQLEHLLPANLANSHPTYLKEFGTRPSSHVLDRKWVRFFVGKNSELVPVNLVVKFYLGLSRGASLVGCVEEFIHAKRSEYRSRLRYFMSFNSRTGDIGYVCKNSMKQLGFL